MAEYRALKRLKAFKLYTQRKLSLRVQVRTQQAFTRRSFRIRIKTCWSASTYKNYEWRLHFHGDVGSMSSDSTKLFLVFILQPT